MEKRVRLPFTNSIEGGEDWGKKAIHSSSEETSYDTNHNPENDAERKAQAQKELQDWA